MQNKLKDFLEKDASATSRCLSCHSKREERRDRFIVGTDGKSYFKTIEGSIVDLGRLDLPGVFGTTKVHTSSPVKTHSKDLTKNIMNSASTGSLNSNSAWAIVGPRSNSVSVGSI